MYLVDLRGGWGEHGVFRLDWGKLLGSLVGFGGRLGLRGEVEPTGPGNLDFTGRRAQRSGLYHGTAAALAIPL